MSHNFQCVPLPERPAWEYWLHCDPALFDQPGLHVLPHPRLQDSLIVLKTYTNTFVAVPEAKATHYATQFAQIQADPILTLSAIITAVQPASCGYILHQGMLDNFQPVNNPPAQPLTGKAFSLLKSLEAACHPTEWSHSGLSYDSETTHACIVDGKVTAAAHYTLLHTNLVNIGILTHPDYRGRGFSTAAASMAMQHALNQGYAVHYQTLLENQPAIALANKLGVRFFGFSMRMTEGSF